MGYNVTLSASNVELPREKLDQIYQIWCAINAPQFNKLKHGGSWSGGKETAKWYSWMDEDYPSTCKNVKDILDMLGFYYTEEDTGNIKIEGYNSKTGQEDLFFVAIAHLLPDSTIDWNGEDGDRFTWEFKDGKMIGYENPFLNDVLTLPNQCGIVSLPLLNN